MIERTVCISIGEVTRASWSRCERLLQAVQAVAQIPVTLLVVPCHDGTGASVPPWFRAALQACLAAGHEVAMHGAEVTGGEGSRRGVADWVARLWSFSGPFGTLSETECAARLARACVWFWAQGWRVHGFVPPEGALGQPAWRVIQTSGLRYTATRSAFHLLAPHIRIHAPCLRPGVPVGATDGSLLRVVLHPHDVQRPKGLHAAQYLVERLTRDRRACTMAGFAARVREQFAGVPVTLATAAGAASAQAG